VLARIRVEGDRVHGRYFYERVGVDLPLEGTTTAGKLSLREGKRAKPSGWFEGTCDAAGRMTGDWSASPPNAGGDAGAARHGAFDLVPIEPGAAPPVIATKHTTIVARPKTVGPFGMKECKFHEAHFEIFGLADAGVERTLNAEGIDPDAPPRWPDERRDVEVCETGYEWEFNQTIEFFPHDFAIIHQGGYGLLDGSAHPANSIAVDVAVWDLRTGRRVRFADVFAKDPMPEVLRCFDALSSEPSWKGADFWSGYVTRDRFVVTDTGLRFYGADYFHAVAAWTGAGPTFPWSMLLGGGYLQADSPVRRLWEGVAPSRGKLECPDPKTWVGTE
jgi:hypothetical protein